MTGNSQYCWWLSCVCLQWWSRVLCFSDEEVWSWGGTLCSTVFWKHWLWTHQRRSETGQSSVTWGRNCQEKGQKVQGWGPKREGFSYLAGGYWGIVLSDKAEFVHFAGEILTCKSLRNLRIFLFSKDISNTIIDTELIFCTLTVHNNCRTLNQSFSV